MPVTQTLSRAGTIFIQIVWIEKVMVDLIILKNHPRIRSFFKKNNMSPGLGRLRKIYWQSSFRFILNEFLLAFPDLPSNWKPLLEDLGTKRDAIAHGRPSFNKETILYIPNQKNISDKKLKEKLKIIRKSLIGRPTKSRNFKIRFDDANFNQMQSALDEFHTKLFPNLCSNLGVKYNQIF